MVLKVGIKHLGIVLYQEYMYINQDSGVTST